MKKKLLGFGLCLGFICLFSISNTTYETSNINYLEDNIDLTGAEVNTIGVDEGSFHILNRNGEKVRLLADFSIKEGYNYNFSSDGREPVLFENSMLYQGLQDGTKTWKNDIETAGGKTNIYLVDAPTLDDILSVGKMEKSYNEYRNTAETPDWLFFDGECYWTKSIRGENVYAVHSNTNSDNQKFLLISPRYPNRSDYLGDIRPVLETSIYNLSSENADVQAYFDSIKPKDAEQNVPSDNANKVQTVKVPSTGIDKPFIFTVVGLAVIIISGITIWTLVKTNKSKKK